MCCLKEKKNVFRWVTCLGCFVCDLGVLIRWFVDVYMMND